MTTPIDLALDHLDKVKKSGNGWTACCPAHQDKTPSLSIAEGDDGRLLLHCFAGCEFRDIMAAIGLDQSDAFPEGLSETARRDYKLKSARAALEMQEIILNIASKPENIESDEDVATFAAAYKAKQQLTDEINALEQPPGWQHPLTKVIELGNEPKPPVMILPSFIGEGVVIIAGAHGVGKTTALMPLAMAAAGIHIADYPLAPREWRHVVYITEDSHQVERIIAGYAPTIGQTPADVGKRVHVVEAARMPPDSVVLAGDWYKENYTRTVTTSTGRTLDLLPLIVFDTKAAVFELENDNDNAEASKMIAAIKQRFAGLPTWIVGHVSKGDLSRDGAKSGMPTFRGASAFEADANQVLYLVKEKDDTRWLVRGKTRFEASWDELLIKTYHSKIMALNVFDEHEELTLRWAIASPMDKTRKELNAEAEETAKRRAQEDKKAEMLDLISEACERSEPINRTELAKEIGGNGKATKDLIRDLIESNWAAEVSVPIAIRTHPKRDRFLIALTNGEREQYQATGDLPSAKTEIPESWKKQPKPEKPKKDTVRMEESSIPNENA